MELLLGLFTPVMGHAVGFDPGFVINLLSVVLNHVLYPMEGSTVAQPQTPLFSPPLPSPSLLQASSPSPSTHQSSLP